MKDFLDTINEYIEKCIKNQDHKMLTAFRNIKSEFVYERSKSKATNTDLIKKMFNKRKETAAIYKDTNQELFENENREMVILHQFLPPELSEFTVLNFLKTLDIEKNKKNFKLFQNACAKEFGQTVDSAVILKYLNS